MTRTAALRCKVLQHPQVHSNLGYCSDTGFDASDMLSKAACFPRFLGTGCFGVHAHALQAHARAMDSAMSR